MDSPCKHCGKSDQMTTPRAMTEEEIGRVLSDEADAADWAYWRAARRSSCDRCGKLTTVFDEPEETEVDEPEETEVDHERPEYVHCVAHERRTRERYADKVDAEGIPVLDGKPIPDNLTHVSWCDRLLLLEFHYVDAAHALNTAHAGSYPMICPECADAMTSVLEPQTWRATDHGSEVDHGY